MGGLVLQPCHFDPPSPGRKKVAIVGFSPSTVSDAPYADEAWEIWGMNQLYRYLPRLTRWFEIHADYLSDAVPDTDYLHWLRTCPVPIYMCTRDPTIPSLIEYPRAEMVKYFGRDFFTSTVSYMLALALYEGFEEIGLWGIDMVADEEFGYQRDGCSWLLGIAEGRGVTLTLPPESALLKSPWRYGYEPRPVDHCQTQAASMHQKLMTRRQELLTELNAVDGGLQINQWWGGITKRLARGQKVPLATSTDQ